MSKQNNLDKILNGMAKIADHSKSIEIVIGLLSAAITLVVKLDDKREKKLDISICGETEHPKTVDEVKECLEQVDVKAVYIPMKVSEADPRYRDCIESQVVDINPSNKIARGDTLQVYYVTNEVIDKSRQLFEENEQQQMMAALKKQEKQFERKDKTKRAVSEIITSVKEGVMKIPSMFHKSNEKEDCNKTE